MEHGPARKPALPTVSIAAAGAAGVSLAVVAVPWLRMSVEAPSLRVALETGGSLLAVTTVGLLVRQCGLRSRADHLWLTAGLVILALTSLTAAALVVAGGWSPDKARYAMGGNLAGTLMLAIAAFAPSRKLRVHPRPHPRRRRACSGVAVFALAALLAGVGPALRAPNANWPTFHPEIGRVIVQVVDRHRADRRRRRAHAPRRAAAALGRRRGRAGRLRQARLRALPAASARERAPRRRPARRRLGRPADRRRRRDAQPLPPARRGRHRRRAPPPGPRAARRRRAGAGLHPPARDPPGRAARTASRSRRPPTARWRTPAARSKRSSRPPTSRCTWPWSASAPAWRPSAASRCRSTCASRPTVRDEVRAELVRIISEAVRNAANHGGARHVRVDLAGRAAGRPDHRRRQRLPRRRQQRPRGRGLRPDRHARAR